MKKEELSCIHVSLGDILNDISDPMRRYNGRPAEVAEATGLIINKK
jgi:hypothetical protein